MKIRKVRIDRLVRKARKVRLGRIVRLGRKVRIDRLVRFESLGKNFVFFVLSSGLRR